MAESKIAVYGAIGANVAIAVTKFAVAGVTGSSAMLSEAVHSTVDTGNGLLLLVGMRRSLKPPSPEHPFGYGRELYFWSLIVAVLIFGLGGGASIFEGVLHVRDPEPMRDPFWNYVVLGAAALFEGTSFAIALRQFLAQAQGRPLWQALHESKDPTVYTVLAEDSAALAGLTIAAVGIYLSHRLEIPALDGVASILIGLLLAGVAALLIHEARGLLVGEGVRPETAREIRRIALSREGVEDTGPALSMYVGAEDVLLALDVRFVAGMNADDLSRTIESIEAEVRGRFPRITRIYIEANRHAAWHASTPVATAAIPAAPPAR